VTAAEAAYLDARDDLEKAELDAMHAEHHVSACRSKPWKRDELEDATLELAAAQRALEAARRN